MPRNGANVFSLPAGVLVTDGQAGQASQHNDGFNDIVTDLNLARPIVAGGTAATTAAGARTNLGLGTAAVAAILGTVSQSGGTPTGAIIEKGSNANGQYTRWADGTQICSKRLFFNASCAAGASLDGDWTYPAAFADTNTTIFTNGYESINATSTHTYVATGADNGNSTTVANIGLRNTSGGTLTLNCDILAFGRWF